MNEIDGAGHFHVKRQIATAPGADLFGSPVFIGIVVAAGVLFLGFGLVTLYYYLKRKKSLASDASTDRPSDGAALEDMKSAVYDPTTVGPNANSDVFNPMPLENSAIHQPLGVGAQYQKLPIVSGDAGGGASGGSVAAASNVTDEEYGELELFKNAEQGGGDVNRDGYGIISKALIKPTEEKLKTKKSKSKVKFDTQPIKPANHEYGSPNLPVVGQYSNTPATDEEAAAYEANQTMAISPETVMLARPVKGGKAVAIAADDDDEVAESRAAMATKKKSSKGKMRAKDSKTGKSLQSFKSAKSGRRGEGEGDDDDGANGADASDEEKPTLGSGKSQSLPAIDL
jgi:hypothetical protein